MRPCLLILLIICLCEHHASGQREIVAVYSSIFQSSLIFYSDSCFEYYPAFHNDLSFDSPLIKRFSAGRYVQHKNKVYYLFSNPIYPPIVVQGNDSNGADSLAHIIITDSVKDPGDKVALICTYPIINYYYLIKICYSHEAFDSIYQSRRQTLWENMYECGKFDGSWDKEKNLAQNAMDEQKSLGFTVANGDYFQHFVCYGKQLDFRPIPNQTIISIEITICSTSSQCQSVVTCKYDVQNTHSNFFQIEIPTSVYQIINTNYYKQAIVEIVNRNLVIFDSQLFVKREKIRGTDQYKRFKYLNSFEKCRKFLKRHKIAFNIFDINPN